MGPDAEEPGGFWMSSHEKGRVVSRSKKGR